MKPTIKQQITALEKSIVHWQEDLLPPKDMKHWQAPIHSDHCALCWLYICRGRKYNQWGTSCGLCPLQSCRMGSQWDKACDAWVNNDRPGFMRARSALIKRMQRALKRMAI